MNIASPAMGSLSWFARHEFNLTWRDFIRMMSAGKPGREKKIIIFMILSVIGIHAIAYLWLSPALAGGLEIDKSLMAILTGSLLLTFSLMMSQSIEQVTRAFYSRSDLDLILSSPVSAKKLFTVRIGSIATSTSILSILLFGSAINVMAVLDSPAWLGAYLVMFALGGLATALSLAITILMFKTLGAKKTRLVSQIIAAIVGAGFVIGIQLAAISSIGSISRFEFLSSDLVTASLPHLDSFWWIPAKAIMGSPAAFLITLFACFASLALAVAFFAEGFGNHVIIASGVSHGKQKGAGKRTNFKIKSIGATLRHKEWKLLLRDHWLLSQTLMQILYLIPPAYMLWQGFGQGNSMAIVAIPVLVMATGQLSGGLAWLAISGEDAPQLVQTAPVSNTAVTRAKLEAVFGAIALLVAPILIFTMFLDMQLALVAGISVAASTISATMIQIWFRTQAKRTNFRRRQTSSKIATIAEAFSSILWAGASGLAAAGSWLFVLILPLIFGILWIARSFRPQA